MELVWIGKAASHAAAFTNPLEREAIHQLKATYEE